MVTAASGLSANDDDPVAGPLAGRRIVVPESRQLDLFSALLERRGAAVVRCPLVRVRALDETEELDAWIRRLTAGRHDILLLYTGEGVAHILARAGQIGLGDEAVAALARAHKIARGPKPVAALRKVGLRADAAPGQPTTDGLLALLGGMALEGRCVGVQTYPDGPDERLRDALAGMGAGFDPVLPYGYVADERDGEVASVIEEMAAGGVDLIAFTSQLQIHRLAEVAERTGLQAALERALATTRIAAIGPVTAEAVAKAGGVVAIQPESNFHLKPFVAEIVELLGGA